MLNKFAKITNLKGFRRVKWMHGLSNIEVVPPGPILSRANFSIIGRYGLNLDGNTQNLEQNFTLVKDWETKEKEFFTTVSSSSELGEKKIQKRLTKAFQIMSAIF